MPGVAGRLATGVAGAVRGSGGDRAGRRHPLRSVPPFVEVVDSYMAQAALGGLLPLAGHRAAVTLMCTAFSGSGCAGGFGLSRFRRGPPFPRLAIPVVTQWPWNLVQALACFAGAGLSWESVGLSSK